MKTLIISILFLTASPYCFAQSAGTIKRAYAYYNVSMPGIQMLDVDGNPVTPKPNVTRFIYVEYRGTKMPDIKEVLYNGSELSFSIVNVKEKTVLIGDKTLIYNFPNTDHSRRKITLNSLIDVSWKFLISYKVN